MKKHEVEYELYPKYQRMWKYYGYDELATGG
jgi:hypothetical protein